MRSFPSPRILNVTGRNRNALVVLAFALLSSVGLALAFGFGISSASAGSSGATETPPNFKVAFFGDVGTSPAVLELARDEGVDAIIHLGDFDYIDDPAFFDQMITDVLGADFPYFGTVGNHDILKWSGSDGYQQKFIDRLNRVPGATCTGDYGVNSICSYQGLTFLLSGIN